MFETFEFREIFLGLLVLETLVCDVTKALIDVFGSHRLKFMYDLAVNFLCDKCRQEGGNLLEFILLYLKKCLLKYY